MEHLELKHNPKEASNRDLCKGPHIDNTSKIKAIKLLNIAGAYWRGDEKRKQMTKELKLLE